MNLGATLATTAWLAASAPAYAGFCRAVHSLGATQSRLLRDYLHRNTATAYGRAHHFAGIRTYAEFARRVPLTDYDALEPWIDRIKRGESAVLTLDSVTRLLPTSGSTRARKLIPFTATLQHEFNAAIGPWMIDLCRSHPSLALGPAYWSVTPPGATPRENSAVPIGFADDSEYLGGTRARFVEAAMAVPCAVRHIAGIEQFRYAVLLHLLRHPDLRLISVWHPSFLTLLLDALPQHWNALQRDLKTKSPRHGDPTRPETLWPALRVVSCWADGHAAGAAAELQRRLPGVSLQPKGLLATEAFVTLPFAGAHPLAICSHFFEFIDERGAIHPAESLRPGETYEVVVTTGGGLWRYRLGDRVEVTGFVSKTPSLRFLGRSGNLSDRCGEKLSDAFVAQAIRAACDGCRPTFALLAPEQNEGAWHYALYLEGFRAPDLAIRLDAALRENPHYALCRDLGQLAPAVVVEIAHGGFGIFAEAETARGLRLGDLKPVALSNQTDWSERFRST